MILTLSRTLSNKPPSNEPRGYAPPDGVPLQSGVGAQGRRMNDVSECVCVCVSNCVSVSVSERVSVCVCVSVSVSMCEYVGE